MGRQYPLKETTTTTGPTCATMCYMTASRVGVRELRQSLSVYLDRVKRGQTLTVTEHHHVVAVLGPVAADRSLMARLVAEGRARPALRPWSARPRPVRATLSRSLSTILEEMRDEDQ